MNISLAHALAGVCSLGALYNLGYAVFGSQGEPNTYKDYQEVSNEDSKAGEPNDPLTPEEAQALVDSLEVNAYLSGILTATDLTAQAHRTNALIYAVGLGAISYLLLQHQSQLNQINTLTQEVGKCQALIHPHTYDRLLITSLKPHPDSYFFGEVAYRIIEFINHLPTNTTCLSGKEPKENCKYDLVDDECVEFCANLSVDLEAGNTLDFSAKPLNSSLTNLVQLSVQERFNYDETREEFTITSNCSGALSPSRPYNSQEIITGKTSLTSFKSPAQIGSYRANEQCGEQKSSSSKTYYSKFPGDLDVKPLGLEAFPGLESWLKNPTV